jgi:hypothetical protein
VPIFTSRVHRSQALFRDRRVWPVFCIDKLERFTTNKRRGAKTGLKAMRG